MLSSTVPEPDANGECCRAIFPLGIRFGSTIELGVMTAPGSTSTRYCAAMCGSKLGERVNQVLGLLDFISIYDILPFIMLKEQ
jgi:hypothetical protein